MRTAFFGGTFDPVHNGHLALAREVLAQGRADRVLLVPAPEPPHKELARITPYEHRLAMVRLAVGDDPRLGWSDVERHRQGKSYTFDTLAELSEAGVYGEIFLLIGADSLRQLHLWYRSHDLVREYGLIVYPRPGEPVTEAELRNHWSAEETAKLLGALMTSVPEFPVSSTQIREIAEKGMLGDGSGFVLPAVAKYITENRLYSK
ncbi:MAG: nicotinate (nicotinamide) nucleotide adenylyltransferase [Lentisphaeria bacterium]|nr:nicotinate (nicotinamide) nucleotide adenylyltransferase [Lentisphaeria bacterium]